MGPTFGQHSDASNIPLRTQPQDPASQKIDYSEEEHKLGNYYTRRINMSANRNLVSASMEKLNYIS